METESAGLGWGSLLGTGTGGSKRGRGNSMLGLAWTQPGTPHVPGMWPSWPQPGDDPGRAAAGQAAAAGWEAAGSGGLLHPASAAGMHTGMGLGLGQSHGAVQAVAGAAVGAHGLQGWRGGSVGWGVVSQHQHHSQTMPESPSPGLLQVPTVPVNLPASVPASAPQKSDARRRGQLTRSNVACDSCHKSKKKCDGGHPCSLCARASRQCIYTPKPGRRRRLTRAEYIATLQDRVRELESLVVKAGIVPSQPVHGQPAHGQPGTAFAMQPQMTSQSIEDLFQLDSDSADEGDSGAEDATTLAGSGMMGSAGGGGGRSGGFMHQSSPSTGSSTAHASPPLNEPSSDEYESDRVAGGVGGGGGLTQGKRRKLPSTSTTSTAVGSVSGSKPGSLSPPQSTLATFSPPTVPSAGSLTIPDDLARRAPADSGTDPLSQAIHLRDATNYFSQVTRDRLGDRRHLDQIDVAVSGFLADPNEGDAAQAGSVLTGSPLRVASRQSDATLTPGTRSSLSPPETSTSTAGPSKEPSPDPTADADMDALITSLESMGIAQSRTATNLMRRVVGDEQPDVALLERYFDLMWYPVIHPGSFFRTLAHQSPLLLAALHCMTSVMSGGPSAAAESHFLRARRLIPLSLDEPCLAAVLALKLVSLYASGSGRVSAGWMYSGMAIRMCVAMRWNEQPDAAQLAKMSPLEWETRKRAWWLCFTTEVTTAAVAGRQMFVDPDADMVDYPDDDVWNALDDRGNVDPAVLAHNTAVAAGAAAVGAPMPAPLVPASASGSHYPTHTSAHYRPLARAMHLFGCAVKYAQHTKAGRTRVGRMDAQLADLGARLRELWKDVGDAARSERAPECGKDGRPTEWGMREFVGRTYFQMVFHAASILLHRPERTPQDFVWPTRASFEVCTYSADRITSLLSLWLQVEPSLAHMLPASNFAIYQAGMVHHVNALVSSHIPAAATAAGSPLMSSSPGAQLREHSAREVAVAVKGLDVLRRYWGSAEAFHASLTRAGRETGVLA